MAYATGLIKSWNNVHLGITNHVLPSRNERRQKNFLSEYDLDESTMNKKMLEHHILIGKLSDLQLDVRWLVIDEEVNADSKISR